MKFSILHSHTRSSAVILVEQTVLAWLIAAAVLLFVVQGYCVSGPCMEPHLYTGYHVMADKLAYIAHGPKRDDIVIFHYPPDPREIFVKRVIGLPGETIAIQAGVVYINGSPIADPDRVFTAHGDMAPQRIPENSYFVMGDNRDNSDDSRFWGDLPRRDLIGRAVACYWPPNAIRVYRGSRKNSKPQ